MRSTLAVALLPALALLIGACSTDGLAPTSPPDTSPPAGAGDAQYSLNSKVNLEVILQGEGFGLVKFRQPQDAEAIIFLDTWVSGLAPNSEYLLQRAVDATVDDDCTSAAWLTLGKGLEAQTIVTDANGTGRAELFRDVSAVPPGSEFDIHFRVVNALTLAVVLDSGCYQYRVSL
jgi:hypothetical protein